MAIENIYGKLTMDDVNPIFDELQRVNSRISGEVVENPLVEAGRQDRAQTEALTIKPKQKLSFRQKIDRFLWGNS